MIFPDPVPFAEALRSWTLRGVWPTTLSSAELAMIDQALLRGAVFSARVTNVEFLDEVARTVDGVLAGTLGESEARMTLRRLVDLGDPAELVGDARLNLIIDTNTAQARGYGQWKQGQHPAVLDEWPAQELFRLIWPRGMQRDWQERWQAAGGRIFEGRMVDLKNSPIWRAISAFDSPWPPYDFNSGMRVRDVSRADAERYGLIEPGQTPPSQDDDFNENLQSRPRVASADLRAAMAGFGDWDGDTFRPGGGG